MTLLLALFVAANGSGWAQPSGAIAIRNARLVPVSGPEIAQGTIVLRNGLIESAGASVTPPPDASVIPGEGLTVYPGLIDPLSTLGLVNVPAPPASPARARGPEDRPATASWLLAADHLSPADARLEAARTAGFTTAVTFPTRGIIAGQGAVINLAGPRPGSLVLQSPAGMYLTLRTETTGGYPGSLLGVFAYIRQIYLDAAHYREARRAYESTPGVGRPAYDKALEGLLAAPRALFPATSSVEIDRVLRFATELPAPVLLYGAHGAYRAVDTLKRHKARVLVDLKWPERARSADPEDSESLRVLELRHRAPATPAALHRAGIPFAFYPGELTRLPEISAAVRKAIDAGLPRDAAIRAFTLVPAEFYGVAQRLGSLDVGKIANLVVTSGPLFEEKTTVRFVFIDGVQYTPAPEAPARQSEATR